MDCPTHSNHQDGYKKIKNYCNQVIQHGNSPFRSITLFCRKTNQGAVGNFERLVKEVFRKYDRCICTFDDIEHSPVFIQYMDEMLERFKDDEGVSMVTGYSYPVKWHTDNKYNAIVQNLEGSIWGVGYWKSKWEVMYDYLRTGALIKEFPVAYKEGKFANMTDWALKDYVNAVVNGSSYNSLLRRVTDVSMRIYLTVANKYAVMPVVSKTRNIGFDGTGAYCEKIGFDETIEISSSNYRFDLQPIDETLIFEPSVDTQFNNSVNLLIINQFDKRPAGEKEEMLAKAEHYCKLSRFEKSVLNVRANTSKVTNKCMRIVRRR